eukprot:2569199-Alexandrium_andersonii.AAC.1
MCIRDSSCAPAAWAASAAPRAPRPWQGRLPQDPASAGASGVAEATRGGPRGQPPSERGVGGTA